MKLTLVKLMAAVVAQFTEAPHYVEFAHECSVGKDCKASVKFNSGAAPALMVTESTEDDTVNLTVGLIVPTNGGLSKPFSVQCENDAQRDRVVSAIQCAYRAWTERDTEAKTEVVALGSDAPTPAAG